MRSLGPQSMLYPMPVLLVGTYDSSGTPNVMAAAYGGICCRKPPCVTVSLREATYTHGNIMARKAYTVSIPSQEFVKEADFAGMASGRSGDKFQSMGLTPVKADHVDAPYVKEFPLVLECCLVQTNELGLHTQFIGEIVDVKADEKILGDNGEPDIEKLRPLLYATGNQAYYAIGSSVGKAFSIGKQVGKC